MKLEIIASQQLKATLTRLLASDDGRVALDATKFVVEHRLVDWNAEDAVSELCSGVAAYSPGMQAPRTDTDK